MQRRPGIFSPKRGLRRKSCGRRSPISEPTCLWTLCDACARKSWPWEGEVRFGARFGISVLWDGSLESISVVDVKTGRAECVRARHLVLACGHSARDTFQAVPDAGPFMERKPFFRRRAHRALPEAHRPFAVRQSRIHPALGAADYKLAVHLESGRGVYTFCMCPGGEVVCAASEEGGVCVNGMSRFAREGRNANAAVLVGVDVETFPAIACLRASSFSA